MAEAGKKLLKYDTFIAKAPGGKNEIKNIESIVDSAEFKTTQELEKKGDFLAAAKEYSAFSRKSKSLDLKHKAMFNASINFEKANAIFEAIKHYNQYLKSNKNVQDNSVKRATRLLANLYERIGFLEETADLFEKYAKNYPSDQYANGSLLNAARIFRAIKKYPKSLSSYRAYRSKIKSKVEKDKIPI